MTSISLPRSARPPRWSKRTRQNIRLALLFLAPWLIGFIVFTLFPMISSLLYSFADVRLHHPLDWIGLNNYKELFKDPLFWKSLSNTAYLVLFGVPLILVSAFFCAVLLNLNIRGQAFYRVIYFLPSIIPTMATALLWIWILNPQYGLFNTFLKSLGIEGPNWLYDPHWSKPGLLLMALWGMGQTIIIFLSSLQEVPVHLMEAASLDGANWWQRLRHVTLPMVSPVIAYNLITGVIAMFQYFAQAYVFASISSGVNSGATVVGSPLNSTLFYSVYLYQNGFQYSKFGYASAMAWILFIIILLCTVVLLKVSEKYTFYT